jgi:uncharacterized damage-inducible protein DinB
MTGAKLLLEFDHEMANTRKTLERLPDEHLSYKPHPKSFTALELAGHIATIPSWTVATLKATELDMDQPFDRPSLESRDDVVAHFDRTSAAARVALAEATHEDLMVPWSLKGGGHTIFTLPRVGVLRSFVMNHLIHHRAQLTVYYRMLDIPVPALYGPSADEN